MGVFIYFSADSRQINRREWEEAFADAVKVAQAGSLCSIEERRYHGHPYFAGIPCMPQNNGGDGGLIISGELETGSTMETHFIPRSLGVEAPEKSGESMLTLYLHKPERYGLDAPDAAHILCNKTQGTAGHIWLLSIACVFCDRFPDATYLAGDITAGQVSRALRLAENVLDRKFNAPIAFDTEALLPRVRELAHEDEAMTARLFFEIYQGLRDNAFNHFVAENFSQCTLYTTFRERAKDASIHSILKDWLLLDLPFCDAARMLVSDPEGKQCEPAKFVKAVLQAKLHVKEKSTYDAAHADNGNEEPDDVGMLFARAAAMIFGIRNWAIDRYIPLEQIKEDCAAVFGDRWDVDALFADAEAALAADRTRQASAEIYGKIDEMAEAQEDYDIVEMKDMFNWTEESATDPNLLDALTKFWSQAYKVTAELRAKFFAADRAGRIDTLAAMGRCGALLSNKTWKKLFANIMDDGKLLRYLVLLGTEWNDRSISEMARVLLYNDTLYEEVLRRTGDLHNEQSNTSAES